MPATDIDVQDLFADVFGNKRGANRPECDILAVPENSSLGFPCAGGCGSRVMPVNAGEDCDQQTATLYCGVCFAAAKAKLERQQGFDASAVSENTPQTPLPLISRILGPLALVFMILFAAVAVALTVNNWT